MDEQKIYRIAGLSRMDSFYPDRKALIGQRVTCYGPEDEDLPFPEAARIKTLRGCYGGQFNFVDDVTVCGAHPKSIFLYAVKLVPAE